PFELHERAMPRIGFSTPGGMLNAALPGEFADLGIRHVAMNIRELFGLRVLCPNALRTAEVGNAGFSGDASAGQRDDARRPVHPTTHSVYAVAHRASLTAQSGSSPSSLGLGSWSVLRPWSSFVLG